MADKQITQLSATTSPLASGDLIVIEKADGSGTKKMTYNEFIKAVSATMLTQSGAVTDSLHAVNAKELNATLSGTVAAKIADLTDKTGWKSIPSSVQSLSAFQTYVDGIIGANQGYFSGYIPAVVSNTIGLLNCGHYLQVYANSNNYRTCIAYPTGGTYIRVNIKGDGVWSDTWYHTELHEDGKPPARSVYYTSSSALTHTISIPDNSNHILSVVTSNGNARMILYLYRTDATTTVIEIVSPANGMLTRSIDNTRKTITFGFGDSTARGVYFTDITLRGTFTSLYTG